MGKHILRSLYKAVNSDNLLVVSQTPKKTSYFGERNNKINSVECKGGRLTRDP